MSGLACPTSSFFFPSSLLPPLSHPPKSDLISWPSNASFGSTCTSLSPSCCSSLTRIPSTSPYTHIIGSEKAQLLSPLLVPNTTRLNKEDRLRLLTQFSLSSYQGSSPCLGSIGLFLSLLLASYSPPQIKSKPDAALFFSSYLQPQDLRQRHCLERICCFQCSTWSKHTYIIRAKRRNHPTRNTKHQFACKQGCALKHHHHTTTQQALVIGLRGKFMRSWLSHCGNFRFVLVAVFMWTTVCDNIYTQWQAFEIS